MSHAASAEHVGLEPAESPLTPESWGKLGMWNFLAADAMSFGGLLAAYGALRYGDPTWPVPSVILGIGLTAFMTFILICSSVTMVEALAAIRQGDQARLRSFLLLTITGGIFFLSCQGYEWTKLAVHEGQSVSKDNFGATFFILTGFHGCHVLGGVIYLSAVLGRAVRGAPAAVALALTAVVVAAASVYVGSTVHAWSVFAAAPIIAVAAFAAAGVVLLVSRVLSAPAGAYTAESNNEVEIVALYWHFVDLIWILVFTFVYLL